MKNSQPTYNGKINEFVDWVTGKNDITGATSTGGLQVSGGAIRDLLQRKLKEPFYMFEDKSNNKYRMFSSEDAYAIWKENPTDNQDLELFNFVRPSDYKLELTPTNSGGFDSRYIRYGESNSIQARIAFSWHISNDEGDSSEGLYVTYTIENSEGGITTFTRSYNKGISPDFSIYKYLTSGDNNVTISCRGAESGARNSRSFTISLVQVSVVSTFKYYEKQYSGAAIQIPYTFERNNISGTAKIYIRIDDGGTGKEYIYDVLENAQTSITEIARLQPTLSEGQHSLQIWAEAKYNDGNTQVNSNLLYYTFTVASTVVGSTGKFINISTQFGSGDFPFNSLTLSATQYEAQRLQWGYYTDSLQTNTSISVTWKLLDGMDDQNPIILGVATANNQEKAPVLQYIPTIYTQEGHETFLCAYFGETLIEAIPIYIVKNNKITVNETGFYDLKMSAYGKTNDSVSKNEWKDESGNVTTTFTGVQWNTNSGWYDNSFRTAGASEYATINFQPFSTFDFTTGKTIEVEFESEKVAHTTDKLVIIGNQSGARIEITPDTATLYDNSNNEVVHTNYKSNERLKLAFIINSIPEDQSLQTVESGLAYIVNNGILERAASASGKSFTTEGNIKIGGTTSGVRIYNIRVYNYSISYTDAYNNFLFDSEDKGAIAERNAILDNGGNISFDECKNKIDTILISGNLSNILSGQTDKDSSATNVTIQRICPFDNTKDFTIENVQIRKHGQSTLNYPITSMKFWLNKSKEGDVPLYSDTQQENLLLNKNRYVMKSAGDKLIGDYILQSGKPSIPANKFVLQANYADSSGVHNGSLERLMQITWFNAQIDGEFKLRTEPQLFATNQVVHHNNTNLGETGNNAWTEGYSNVPSKANTQWSAVTNAEFPYDIRISPDSFPCAVFYYDENGTRTRTFLGQYVWMDDKKSDYCYGERSIYAVPADPFCLTNTHKDDDTDENLVWDNKNVLRVEVVGSNVPFTSYMTHNGFTDIVTIEGNNGATTRKYNWEQAFEMIYPDEDDLYKDDAKNGIDKFNANSKYVRKIQPFINFHEWVVSTYQNQQKFQDEAAQHLDLYKMAAYYIFVLRFGLVDSLERNAQIKTYDGIHWHYEPWDMDIALGNKNDGGIAFNPPIDRNTKLPGSITTYAISGRSADSNGDVVTSNWLFDALEHWDYWMNTIVPNVADALYSAGLKYSIISDMFDNEYSAKWCEIMYNQSGFFKYVESGGGDPTWLSWLQGSRMTHRHWWLSNSMDYYDAKWFCGDYKNHYIYIRANVTEGSNQHVIIKPNKQTYMSVTKDGALQSTQTVDTNSPLDFNMTIGSNTKNPIYFYGANFMEEIDLSQIAQGLDGVTLDGVYSDVLGSPLKRLNVGIQTSVGGVGYTGTLASLSCQIQGAANVFENLQFLNIRGQVNQTDMNAFIYNNDINELQEIQAMGSGITNFYSSQSGNTFSNIELPDTVYTIWMNNSSWDNMSFWHTNIVQGSDAEFQQVYGYSRSLNLQNGGIPTTVHNISLLGTTGSTLESIKLVKNWLSTLVSSDADLSEYNLIMDKVNWSNSTVGATNLLTYDELELISQLGNQTSLKGYIVLMNSGQDLTSAQLNNIKSWFGDTVFTKNSSGLVIDHERQYVQINIGGNVTVDALGGVTLLEGNSASLNATRFSLAEDDTTQYAWAVGPVGGSESYGRYNGLTVVQQDSSIDGIAYITSVQSQVGHDYDVQVTCSVEGRNYTTTMHVVAATYPTTMYINAQTEGLIAPRNVGGYTELYQSGQGVNLTLASNDTYTGVINKVTYTLTRLSDNASVSYIAGGSGADLSELHDDYIVVQPNRTNDGLKISCDAAMPGEDEMYFYKVTATARFVSGIEKTAEITVMVCDDVIPIVSSNQVLFNPVNDSFTTQTGSSIGRNYFYKADLLSLTGTINFSSYSATLPNLVTSNGSYLFKYIPNITGIVLDGCSITDTSNSIQGEDKRQFLFTNTTKLETLSIQNCTGLVNDVDITMCPDITQVDASGTFINVLVPENAKLTKYELGTPTSISLINPTVLTPEQIKVDNYANLNSLELVNIPNVKSFNMFGKITRTIGAEVLNNIYLVNGAEISNGSWKSTTPIYNVSQGQQVTLSTTGDDGVYVYTYNSSDVFVRGYWGDNGSVILSTTQANNPLSYIRLSFRNSVTAVTMTDSTTGQVIFKYEA